MQKVEFRLEKNEKKQFLILLLIFQSWDWSENAKNYYSLWWMLWTYALLPSLFLEWISSSQYENFSAFSDQHASSDDADTINTLITSNVPDTETVFSFSITLSSENKGSGDMYYLIISEFLPLTDRVVTMSMGSRFKRNGQRILTSVIKELAVVLYKFKKLKLSGYTSYQMEAEINDCESILYGKVAKH